MELDSITINFSNRFLTRCLCYSNINRDILLIERRTEEVRRGTIEDVTVDL
jgi:hypothetical protein